MPKEYCKTERLKFRRPTGIAAELIRAFTPPKGVKVRVSFDALCLCKPVSPWPANRRVYQVAELSPVMMESTEAR